MHLQASHTYLSSISTAMIWLWHGPHFPPDWSGEARGCWVSQKCKTSSAAALSFRTCRRCLKMSGVKSRMVWKLPFSWRAWNRPFSTYMAWGLPMQTPPRWLSGESLPAAAGETHQEDGWPPDQPLQAGWSPCGVGWVQLGKDHKHN